MVMEKSWKNICQVCRNPVNIRIWSSLLLTFQGKKEIGQMPGPVGNMFRVSSRFPIYAAFSLKGFQVSDFTLILDSFTLTPLNSLVDISSIEHVSRDFMIDSDFRKSLL